MRIVVTGSSGLIGTALVRRLRTEGHQVVRLVRRAPKADDEVRWDPGDGTIDSGGLEGVDAAVHLAGEGIGDRRWTAEQKRRLLESRTLGTTLLSQALADLGTRPTTLVSASGINAYGFDRGDQVLTEADGVGGPKGGGFLADLVRQWEAATASAEAAGIRVVHLRNGIVLSPKGGALARQLPLFKLGLGGRLGGGKNWWSWISLDDEVSAIRHCLEVDALTGPVNSCAPNPVRGAELAKAIGHALGRPSVLPVPRFGPGLVFGSQMAEEVVFANLRVQPAALLASGFRFAAPEIEPALTAILQR